MWIDKERLNLLAYLAIGPANIANIRKDVHLESWTPIGALRSLRMKYLVRYESWLQMWHITAEGEWYLEEAVKAQETQ